MIHFGAFRPISRAAVISITSGCWLVCAATRAVSVQPLTIERITSAPFPSQMVAAPKGSAVAWVYNERGARNVWLAERHERGYVSRRLTVYTGDAGLDINELTWSADARKLFYTLGGDDNGLSAVNPLSLPSGPRAGEVWSVGVDGAEPKRVAAGTDPNPSPGGDALVFISSGQPFLLRTEQAGEAEPLFRDQGQVVQLAWSPDGSKLAFVSQRTRHSIVGVFDLAKKSITWMSPGIDADRSPTWSPDGHRLAFIRAEWDELPTYVVAHHDGLPFEIWVGDADSGQASRVWRAAPGPGSHFRELFNSPQTLFWAAGDQLVFPWEVTGWLRLYALALHPAASARLLTPGQAEVFGAALSDDRRRLVYSSNFGDLDRRHIWSLSLDGGPPHQLTAGYGVEDFPVETRDHAVFAIRGEAQVPMRPVLVGSGGVTDLAPTAIPADFPATELVDPQLVTFPAADGVTVHGQLFVPKGGLSRRPALLFFHGGPTDRQTFPCWDPFETHTHLYEANQYLANNGYVVLSVNYRGGVGYGLEFREARGFGAGGASELNDIIGAAKYLSSRPEVDPKRMGVWGGSYGGRMASLALAEVPEYFAAGVDIAGVSDWLKMPELTSSSESVARLAYQSSAIAHVDRWRAPVLLVHADTDPNVPLVETSELAQALRTRGIPVEYFMIPDEVHFLLRHDSWNRVFVRMHQFLDERLKGPAPPGS
jgi:dipeptidyl aminopeptidase/acylaminoacyl peptidase